jgi:alpha-pyrone synthase
MSVIVRTIQTAVPSTVLVQAEVRDVFASQPGVTRLTSRLLATSFDGAGISTRRSVIDDFDLSISADIPIFFDKQKGELLRPGTRIRNELYIEKARALFIEAGTKALAACKELKAEDITHVITVSCTGFYAPGPEYDLVRALNLAPSTLRYHIGFMGCYAAFPALRAAQSFCEANPRAVVLVVSAELCSLHVRSSNDPDQIMAASMFGDGAAAAIVTARETNHTDATLRIDRFESVLTPVGEEDMTWKIGDEGFEMLLSTYVPKIVDTHIQGALEPLFAPEVQLVQAPAQAIRHWAIHPGGRSILDKVETKLGLSEQQLVPSRQTLNDWGNMSSATVLFVLKYILDNNTSTEEERICTMAFGPGITVETGLLTRVPATATV